MPKIPQYNRRQFQSSYIGGPQVDQSGVALAEGISKGLAPIMKVEADKLHTRQQNIIDQQADTAVMQYSLEYSKRVEELWKENIDNPSGGVSASFEAGAQLAQTMGAEIKNEAVRARFLAGANTMVKQSVPVLVKRGIAQDEANALSAAEGAVRIASLTAGQTKSPEIFFNNVEAVELKLKQIPNLDPEEARKLLPDMLESHLYTRTHGDPEAPNASEILDAVESDLLGGMYSDLESFDSDMKEKFLNDIRSQRRYNKQEERKAQDDTYSTVIDEIADRALPFGDLLARVDSLKDALRPRDYTRAKKSLFTRIGSDAAALLSSEPKSVKYINAVYDTISSDVGRAEKNAFVLDLFDQGLTKDETRQLNQMRRELEGPSRGETALKFLNNNRGYLDLLFRGDPTAQANTIRDYLTEVRTGKSPVTLGEEMIQKAARSKVVKQDPSLAQVKDPVEERYIRLATAQLRKDGKPASDAMIKWMVAQLKAMEKNQ